MPEPSRVVTGPARARALTLELTALAGVTGTPGEARFAPALRDILLRSPAFAGFPDRVRLVRLPGEPEGRALVFALLPGAGEEALVLSGHYDVVDTADFGPLAPWAFDPEALAPRLCAALRAEGALSGGSDDLSRALVDLESGGFLPGRGVLDMKSGLAAGIVAMEIIAERRIGEDLAAGPAKGSLVFMAVPDEEGGSAGMRAALAELPRVCSTWGIIPVAAINLDAAVDPGEGDSARVAFLGSVGKLHPFFLVAGLPAHAGAPFEGLSAALIAAELVRSVELEPDLFDGDRPPGAPPGETPAPPAVLYCRDLRRGYDVTTPASIFVSLNVLVHRLGPAEVLRALEARAAFALGSALALIRERAARQGQRSGLPTSPPIRRPRVVGWRALAIAARAADAAAFGAASDLAAKAPDRVPACGELAETALRLAGIDGPAIVVGLAPPWYPRAELDPDAGDADARLHRAVAALAAASEIDSGQRVGLRPFFPGISDMSLLSPHDGPEALGEARAACPVELGFPQAALRIPAVNLGPWGREYHRRLERVHAGYAFRALPRLITRLVGEFFGETLG